MTNKFTIKTVDKTISPRITQNFIDQIAKELRAEQEIAIDKIVKRTRSGKNVRGQNFPRYTEAYRRRKAAQGLRTSPVDLTLSGRMLGSLRQTVKQTGRTIRGRIFVSDPDRGKVEGVQVRRPFMGISKEVQAIFDGLRRKLNINQANRR